MIRYDQEKLLFLEKKIQQWVKAGYIYEGYTPYAYVPVIVPKKGSEPFRVCFNF